MLKGLDAMLITNPTNIRYLTGFVGVVEKKREAYLFITANQAVLFTSSLYLEQARKLELLYCYIVKLLKTKNPIQIMEISKEKPVEKRIANIVKNGRMGFEEADLTVAEYKNLKGMKLVATKYRVESLRQIKREDEIENIRQACKLTDACFSQIIKDLKPGVTEGEIQWKIESFIRMRGAGLAFSPIVAFGKNTSQPHYLTVNDERLTNNSLVLLDFGARVNGYCSDMTRVVFVGKPKPEWVSAYAKIQHAQEAALKALASGERSGAKLDAAARRYVKYPHSLGHNIGLDIHESPRLSVKKDVTLKPGMVFSIEPGVYIEGQYGIRIEDLVLLKQDGIEILSQSSKEIQEI